MLMLRTDTIYTEIMPECDRRVKNNGINGTVKQWYSLVN